MSAYYILTGVHREDGMFEMIWGSAVRAEVEGEKDCIKHNYRELRITRIRDANNVTIMAAVEELRALHKVKEEEGA